MHFKRAFKRLGPIGWIMILAVILLAELTVAAGLYIDAKLDRIGFAEDTAQADHSADMASLDYYHILLIGTDERAPGNDLGNFGTAFSENARADACMLLSLDMKKHTANLISLERAIGVTIESHGEDWLTHVFAYGGADAMLKTVREQLGVPVYRYVRVNVGVAAQLIDAIGGVDITLTEAEAAALNGEVYSNATTKNRVEPGLNHLNGFDAIAYARQRFIDSDFHRVQRQRNVLQAAIIQTKALSLKQLDHLLNVALPMVQTNFTRSEIAALLPKAPGFLGVTLRQMTLPLKGMYGNKNTDDGRSMMMLDPQESMRILNEFLYGDFDPESYVASDEVKQRVQEAQKQAEAQWQRQHSIAPTPTTPPPVADSGIAPHPNTEEEEVPPDAEQQLVSVPDGERPRDETNG